MRVLSVNVGMPREIVAGGKTVRTGIFKTPVSGRIEARKLNLEGDGQADLTVHGGPNKAIYAYPSEHYSYWQQKFPDMNLPWGMFGENLTLEGLTENDVCVGDRFRMGTAVLMATQPRLPCYKLGIRFGRNDIIDQFLTSGRTGFYFAVVEPGEIGKDDLVERIEADEHRISISTLLRLIFIEEQPDARLLKQALNVKALSAGWRTRILKKLEKLTAQEADSHSQ